MRGDTKHVINEALETINRLTFNKAFQADIKQFRSDFSIPVESFAGKMPSEKYEIAKAENNLEYIFREIYILKKYGILLTNTLLEILDFYIVNGGVAPIIAGYPNTSFLLEIPNREEIAVQGRSFIKVIIYNDPSKDDMINFITKKARLIKYFLNIQNPNPKKNIVISKNQSMDRRMMELNEIDKKELQEMLVQKFQRQPRWDKYKIIYEILKQEGFTPTSAQAIKRAIQRKKSGTSNPRD